ncbi:hypothetical protein [Geodermatophilus maliterrae]|uniref:Uncharacterized protein n=1 Tax=Geodermatophilus maliterrae TaxID=3162531 RepID=A0ABV3XE81_9ACTN
MFVASSAVPRPDTRRRAHPAGRVALALLGGALLLSGCTGGADDDAAASSAADATTEGPPVGDPPSEEVDAVQTDAPVTERGVVVTYTEVADGRLQVGAFVQGVVELGGTCTVTATGEDGSTVTGESEAEPGPSSTDCVGLAADLPADASGTWRVSVTYSSGTGDLESDEREVAL